MAPSTAKKTATVNADLYDESLPVDFMANGVILVRVDRVVRLRPPKVGEMRTLTSALQTASDILRDVSTRSLAFAAEASEREAAIRKDVTVIRDPDALDALGVIRNESSKRSLEISDKRADLLVDWMQSAFDLLSLDGPVKVAEDGEAWLATMTVARKMLDHWSTVPFDSGS
jgi:hypothetical protein